MRSRTAVLGVTLVAGLAAMGGTPAMANHGHFVVITDPNSGETTCQYLASGESEPAPNHPLHNNVHTGRPGSDERGTDFDKEQNEETRCDEVRGG